MWRRGAWKFYFGIPAFGFYFHGRKPPPAKEEYLNMLQEYKKELEEELEEVSKEIEEVRKSS